MTTIGAPASAAHNLTSVFSPNRQGLRWSLDGRSLALLAGDAPARSAYISDRLALLDAQSGTTRVLTGALDRAVLLSDSSADGRSLDVMVEDDGYQYPAAVDAASGSVTRLADHIVVQELKAQGGYVAVIRASDSAPPEIFALEKGVLRALTTHNTALFAELTLGTAEDLPFKSRDGTEVHGQLVKPPGFEAGRHYPTIVWIHGGPNGQDDHAMELSANSPPLERSLFATHGYVVLAINSRGSTGRGDNFARSIRADWGHHEVEDLRAGVDAVIARNIADPARLGIGDWSYGGILTDGAIAIDLPFSRRDQRCGQRQSSRNVWS